MEDQPMVTDDAIEAALHGTRRPRVQLQRLDGPPVSIHTTKGVEAQAFVKLFPTGNNHFDTRRDGPLCCNTSGQGR